MADGAARGPGGRPTARAAALLDAAILEKATEAFLADGYAATTIEAIARTCRVAKRTIYARWDGKSALFTAVLERLIAKWLAGSGAWPEQGDLKSDLTAAAACILNVALSPEAVLLHRIIIAESRRFPELPQIMRQAGGGEGQSRIASLLDRAVARGDFPPQDTAFAAEQFLSLLLAGPQRRALGLGLPLDHEQLQLWRDRSVGLFLHGTASLRLLQRPE